MPTIRLSDQELEHLRAFYADELQEANKYVEQVRTIISKLKTKDKPKFTKPSSAKEVAQPVKKRGRKPAVKVEPKDTVVPQPLVRKAKTPKIAAAKPVIEPAKKRGRKPSVKVDAVITEQSEPKVRAKRAYGKKKAEQKMMLPEIPSVVPDEKIAANVEREKSIVIVKPKPKKKRTSNYRRKGVYLTSWSKPLAKKPDLYQNEPEDNG